MQENIKSEVFKVQTELAVQRQNQLVEVYYLIASNFDSYHLVKHSRGVTELLGAPSYLAIQGPSDAPK